MLDSLAYCFGCFQSARSFELFVVIGSIISFLLVFGKLLRMEAELSTLTEKNSLDVQIQKLSSSMDAVKIEHKDFNSEITGLKVNITGLKVNITGLKVNITGLDKANKDFKENARKQGTELKKHAEKIQMLEGDVSFLAKPAPYMHAVQILLRHLGSQDLMVSPHTKCVFKLREEEAFSFSFMLLKVFGEKAPDDQFQLARRLDQILDTRDAFAHPPAITDVSEAEEDIKRVLTMYRRKSYALLTKQEKLVLKILARRSAIAGVPRCELGENVI